MTELTIDNWQDFDLDPNVVLPVMALTGCGFITKSSCGGHPEVEKGETGRNGRRALGEWYITFVAPKDRDFSAELAVLTSINVVLEKTDDTPEACTYYLAGIGAPPASAAFAIALINSCALFTVILAFQQVMDALCVMGHLGATINVEA